MSGPPISLIAAVGEAYDDSMADGKLNWKDTFNLTGTIDEILAFVPHASNLKAEVADLDDAEREELVDYFKEEFDIDNDKVEGYIEKAVELINDFGPNLTKALELGRSLLGK